MLATGEGRDECLSPHIFLSWINTKSYSRAHEWRPEQSQKMTQKNIPHCTIDSISLIFMTKKCRTNPMWRP